MSAETGREDSSALGGFPHRFLLSGRQLVHLFREAAHSQRTQEPLPLHWQHLRRPTRLEMRSLSNLDCSIASSTWGSRRGFSSIPQKSSIQPLSTRSRFTFTFESVDVHEEFSRFLLHNHCPCRVLCRVHTRLTTAPRIDASCTSTATCKSLCA